MPNWGRRKHNRRPGSPKGIKPKSAKRSTYKAPPLSSQARAALENMSPVVVRTVGHSPDVYDHSSGWMGEYSIRSCNNNRR